MLATQYTKVRQAIEEMVACNSGRACADHMIAAFNFSQYEQQLPAMEAFFITLTDEEIQTFVDGDELEIEDMIAANGEPAQQANALLTDFFENANWQT